MSCKNCKSTKLIKRVEIGDQPLSGFFYKKIHKKLPKYSLDLFQCKVCGLVQIKNKFNVKKMYGQHYGYETSKSKLMVNHLKEKVHRFKKKGYFKKGNSIIDIGSNDGTFLNLIGDKNIRYGVDPSGKKFADNYRKITLINNFFSRKKIKPKNIKFDMITSFAIFYDVEDPNQFCLDIKNILKPNGVWICELSYLPLMLKNLTFDQICHEHVTYYSLNVFEKIINKNGLKLLDVKLNEINGGSIEIICTHKSSRRSVNKKFIDILKRDELKINKRSFLNFSNRIKKIKKDLNSFLENKKNILGYGASTKGNVVLNFCKITRKKLKLICDANEKKFGSFTPGSNIPIISKEKMRKIFPKYLLVLIWSFRKEVIKQEINYIKSGGNLVFHLPKFHIINKKNYRSYLNKDFKDMSYRY
tara:strand:- start:2376 stop:3620 length:1245 start_codon:yes stop_codon:yes gene_type:complete